MFHRSTQSIASRPRRRSFRVLALAAGVAAALLTAAAVYADQLPPGSAQVLPNTAGSAATLRWTASFAQPTAAELLAYNVDIARGYHFDPRAVRGRCTLVQARTGHCPRDSQMGRGQGRVTVITAPGQSHEFGLGINFFIMRPQRRGDIAGLVLAAHEPGSGITFDLVGRLVRLRHGPFGLELRFADTAAELPKGITVQLHRVDVHFGTHRTVTHGHGAKRHRVRYDLLRNPMVCRQHRWPFLLTVTYTTGSEKYYAYGACRARGRR
jgi:hypothetical protein